MYFSLLAIDRSHSFTYCTPFQATEDVVDMMIVAEVCSMLRRLVGFVCFIYSPDAVQAMEEVCHLTLVIFFVVRFLLVANTQLTPFRLWRRYVLFL